MNLKFIEKNKEKILPIVLFGSNRDPEIVEHHKKVMVDYFKLEMNYIECPFPNVSHGFCMNKIINETLLLFKLDEKIEISKIK